MAMLIQIWPQLPQKQLPSIVNYIPQPFPLMMLTPFSTISKDLIPCIDDEFAELCDADITPDKLDKAVESLSLNKSPCSDSLTTNFYKHFWDLLKESFFALSKEATDTMSFPPTMKQGTITLIPKTGKDPKIFDNF